MLTQSPSRSLARHEFAAMASPCSVLIDGADAPEAKRLGAIAEAEARRIERKFSRYRDDSVLSAINRSDGRPVSVDPETMALLDYAVQCHALSDGLFDITSGVLRRLWRFDGSATVPDPEAIEALLPLIGMDKVRLEPGRISLMPGMEIDFGGLGKEYAVDRALLLLQTATDLPVMVNFGGDLRVSRPRRDGRPWRVAIEQPDDSSAGGEIIEIVGGALTTSGDSKRFLLKDGVRYSHILDPRTGWPVVDPPRSVTVGAGTCMEAGIISTLAMAKGREAEAFLASERCLFWIAR